MALAQVTYRIDGQELINPREWLQQKVVATYENDIIQPNVTIERFSFVNEDAKKIREHINKGFIFEGMPFSVQAKDEGNVLSVFEGFLDLAEDFEVKSPVEVVAKAKQTNGLNNLSELLQAQTVGYLESIGVYSAKDYEEVEYLVEKKINVVELAIMSVTIYLLAKQIAESVKQIADDIAEGSAHGTGGGTGAFAAAVFFGAKLAINIAFTSALILALVKMIDDLLSGLLPIVRRHKGITLYTLVNNVLKHLGYDFVCPISEMRTLVYLPSRPFNGEPITKGIPNVADFGYNLSDALQLCLRLFNAKAQVVGNTVHLRTKGDDYWRKTSTYKLPDVLAEAHTYNTEELVSNKLISFTTDVSDDWTIDNYTGTSFGVNTSQITTQNRKLVNIKNFQEINIPCALGSRKNGLSDLEKALKEVAHIVDSITGKNSAKKVKNRVGMLKVSTPNHTVSKLLVLNNGRMPSSYRTDLSAKTLYEKYHAYDSFVTNAERTQKKQYTQVRIPFNLSDFLQLAENSFFTTYDNRLGKMNKVEWEVNNDFAIVDYDIEEPYTNNLKETFTEN